MKFKKLKEKLYRLFNSSESSISSLSSDERTCIEKIKQLQEELYKLKERKKFTKQQPTDIIGEIIYEDINIREDNLFKEIEVMDYDYKKDIINKWMNFIEFFNILEYTSKDKIIDYLIYCKETKQFLQEIDQQIYSCKQHIASEKSKLGIE